MVKVKGDDTFRKLEQLEGGGNGGGRRGGASAGGGVFQRLESIGTNQLFQLGAIVTGIGGLTAVMTKASGHLQATFKLWETSMLLIFRPFGDFVGMLFRPFVMAMLGTAMPFYRAGAKWYADFGQKAGEKLVDLIGVGTQQEVEKTGKDLGLGPTKEQKERAQAAYDSWVEFFENLNPNKLTPSEGEFELGWGPEKSQSLWDVIKEKWDEFTGALKTKLLSIPATIFKVWTQFKDTLWSWLVNIPQIISVQFTNLGLLLGEWFGDIPSLLHDVFTGLASNIASTLSNLPQLFWGVFEAIANSLMPGGDINSRTGTNLPAGSGTPNRCSNGS